MKDNLRKLVRDKVFMTVYLGLLCTIGLTMFTGRLGPVGIGALILLTLLLFATPIVGSWVCSDRTIKTKKQ